MVNGFDGGMMNKSKDVIERRAGLLAFVVYLVFGKDILIQSDFVNDCL